MTEIIEKNRRYYPVELLQKKIKWCFVYDANLGNFAHYSGTKDLIYLNILSVADALENGEGANIEFFLLHEIRHMYQNLAIDKYKKEGKCLLGEEYINRWIKEKKKYLRATDEKGNLNLNHFKQDIEKDAYAFACGVLYDKYNSLPDYLFIKREKIYNQEFYNIVEGWAECFNREC